MRAGRAWVVVFGGLGLALVARAALFYRSTDAFAFALVLLIGLGLALGLVELVLREARAHRLLAELASLPQRGSEEAIASASPPLRALLRTRLGGVNGPTSAPFTPYLLGLLVMVGMLGTFLGLFETLRGAREALAASGDVEALRSGLAAPMTGLTRAFGTSAAGVAASAMLGLAAVFVRRAEAALANAITAYVTGPLAALTPTGRQLLALERLAEQGEALPLAAAALHRASERVEALEARLAELHEQRMASAASAALSVATSIGAELERGLRDATAAAAASVEPLLDRAVERAGAAATESLAGWTRRIDAEAETRRSEDSAHQARLLALSAATHERVEGSASKLISTMTAELDRLRAVETQRGEALAQQIAELWPRLGAELHALGERLSAPLAEVSRAAQAAPEAAARLVDLARERLDAHEQADGHRDARLDALLGRLDAHAALLRESTNRQALALQAQADAADARAQAAEARTQERLLGLAALTEEALTKQAAAHASLEARLAEERSELTRALSTELAKHASRLGEEHLATSSLVREAATLLRGGGAELSAVAELFTLAVDRYRGASEQWQDSLSHLEAASARQAEAEAVDLLASYVDQTREVFEHSIALQRELFAELRALRSGPREGPTASRAAR